MVFFSKRSLFRYHNRTHREEAAQAANHDPHSLLEPVLIGRFGAALKSIELLDTAERPAMDARVKAFKSDTPWMMRQNFSLCANAENGLFQLMARESRGRRWLISLMLKSLPNGGFRESESYSVETLGSRVRQAMQAFCREMHPSLQQKTRRGNSRSSSEHSAPIRRRGVRTDDYSISIRIND